MNSWTCIPWYIQISIDIWSLRDSSWGLFTLQPFFCSLSTLDNKTPKKGEVHLRVEGLEWQNMSFEARPPACCSLLISWWGQANYNSLLMPLFASFAFSPATAVFPVHSSAKRFERYTVSHLIASWRSILGTIYARVIDQVCFHSLSLYIRSCLSLEHNYCEIFAIWLFQLARHWMCYASWRPLFSN